jgi:ribosomal protein L11 methylase PrmA
MNGITQAVDFGANNGSFSTPLAEKGIFTIAADGDPVAINKLYKKIRGGNIRNMIPLVVDFTNPSPAMGLGNEERTSFLSRIGDQNLGLCLAFIHHLCIGKNIPLQRVAEILARSCKQLIIEFVPKEDEKATLLLARKKDIYPDYHVAGFEQAFASFFSIDKKIVIPGSCRILYQMMRK